MRRDQLPAESKRSYVLPRYKVVYVSTPKAACTSLKWVIAELGGEDLDGFRHVLRPGTTTTGVIHPRRYWQRVPTLHRLPADELAEVAGENGWHIFAVVRHPASRLFSAWQEKVLLREPFVLHKVPPDLLPTVPPQSTAEVVDAFQRFVVALVEGKAGGMADDPHFLPQEQVLAAERMPYTRVYTVAEMDRLMADLGAQVHAHGGGPVPSLPETNETPLKPLRSMFTAEVVEAIRRLYVGDFERWFADADVVPSSALDGQDCPASLLAEVGRLADRHARIGQVVAIAERLQQENAALLEELAKLRT